MRAALTAAALAALCGAGAGQLFPPPPPGTGWCRDTVDQPFAKDFYQWTKCCVDVPEGNPVW